MFPGLVLLEFFSHSQQQNTDDDNSDECVGLPVQLFLQENTGQQQGDHADRGQDGSSNGIHTAQGVDIGELTGGLENGCQDLVLMLGNAAELDTFGLHEDEQD